MSEIDDMTTEATSAPATSTREPARVGAFRRMYRGQTQFDFVGRRKIWFTISALIIVGGIAAMGVRGLNLGIDFRGGSIWEVQAKNVSVDAIKCRPAPSVPPGVAR